MAATLPLDHISSSIDIIHIQTPRKRIQSFPLDATQRDVQAKLLRRDFDHAPVTDGASFVGYVRRNDLNDSHQGARVAEKLLPIDYRVLLAANTGIREALRFLAQQPFWFMLEGNDVVGIATPSDFNKQAARTYFYLLTSELEMMLADAIRWRYPNQTAVLKWLEEGTRQRLVAKYQGDRSSNTEADVVSNLYFRHLLQIAGESRSIKAGFRLPAKWQWETLSFELNRLRNDVSHPVRNLIGNERSITTLIDLEDELRRFLARRPRRADALKRRPRSLDELAKDVFGSQGWVSGNDGLREIDYNTVFIQGRREHEAFGLYKLVRPWRGEDSSLTEAFWNDLERELETWGIEFVLVLSTRRVEFKVEDRLDLEGGFVAWREGNSNWVDFDSMKVVLVDLSDAGFQRQRLALLRQAKKLAQRLVAAK